MHRGLIFWGGWAQWALALKKQKKQRSVYSDIRMISIFQILSISNTMIKILANVIFVYVSHTRPRKFTVFALNFSDVFDIKKN